MTSEFYDYKSCLRTRTPYIPLGGCFAHFWARKPLLQHSYLRKSVGRRGNGADLFRQENPCRHDPAKVMGKLLGDGIDERFMRDVFDHEVELNWHDKENRAVELLGNILAGRDPERLMQVLNPELLSDYDEKDIYVDDTTIIVCPLTWEFKLFLPMF